METFSTSFNNCWKAANQLSHNEKLMLIAKLSSSMERSENHSKVNKNALVDSLYGAWSDQNYPDSDEMNQIIRESRHTNRDILELI